MLTFKKIIITLAITLTTLAFSGVEATEVNNTAAPEARVEVSYQPNQIIIKKTDSAVKTEVVSSQIDAIIALLNAAE